MSTNTFNSTTISADRLLPGIHGLRGIAALAVVLFHLAHIAKISPPPAFSFIASSFGYGVHLFFVLSAFSLMHSTEYTMQRANWVKQYLVKRFFRIAPLYYTILAGMFLWTAILHHESFSDLPTLLLNITFTFGFAPWSGIVFAGWTVGVEAVFYTIFPVILLTSRTVTSALALVIFSIIVSVSARSILNIHYEHTLSIYGYNWAYFSPPANLCFFMLGIYGFRVSNNINKKSITLRLLLPIFSITLLIALMLSAPNDLLQKIWNGVPVLWGICFVTLTIWQGIRPSRWSANRLFQYFGERSYSIYLLHPLVIVAGTKPIRMIFEASSPHLGTYAFFLCAILLLLILVTISELTYRLIEVPGITLGKYINRHTHTTFATNIEQQAR